MENMGTCLWRRIKAKKFPNCRLTKFDKPQFSKTPPALIPNLAVSKSISKLENGQILQRGIGAVTLFLCGPTLKAQRSMRRCGNFTIGWGGHADEHTHPHPEQRKLYQKQRENSRDLG
jgi:hypothetical protein